MAIDLSALSVREALSAIYIGYYDRAADPAGIEFWEGVVDNTSLDLVAITSDFASQAETQAVHPFFANPTESAAGAFITTLYLNLFNREPDADGLAFWTDALQAAVAEEEGALTVGEIITAIIEGAEDIEGGTQDRTTILNKIEVALSWTEAAEDSDIDYATNSAAQASAASIIDDVTDQQASVDAAQSTIDDFFDEDGNNGGVTGDEIDLGFGGQDPVTGQITPFDNLTGTDGGDRFHAEDGALVSGDQIDGGAGRDSLTAFIESSTQPISARTESVESVYITNQQNIDGDAGDNNIAGFENTGVDVEIDGGRQIGVDRWEDFDSRADLVIEDARDDDDIDGTFTGDITVAMVSTDPGNVDFAVYFDGPVNTAANDDSIFIEVIDQNNSSAFSAAAITGATEGNLTDAQLTQFAFLYEGNRVTVDLDTDVVGTAHFGANATYTDLVNAIQAGLDATQLPDGSTLGDDVTASLGDTFDENIGDDNAGEATNSDVFGLRVVLRSDSGAELGDAGVSAGGEGDITVISRDDPADTAQAISNEENVIEELIRLNVELDDVGKGSMGGDALFGAMSTGRQNGDDRTSDSIGIQQFDIEVDRSSQLQTINSTNNALEVVNISNGENNGINNTTTAADEMVGDLVVRGQADPGPIIADGSDDGTDGSITNGPNFRNTDAAMPGGQPQHNAFGFSDVRVINAAAMIGAVDITAELTEEIVEKYLDMQDGNANGEFDDVAFQYTLGSNDDEFFLNMTDDALNSAGTGSREDFDMTTAGGAGDDVITTNVGSAAKFIDERGQDSYEMVTENNDGWYDNSVFTNASTFTIDGGAGNDTIWTHGWGDANITDGEGEDTVYTDNSGTITLSAFFGNIDRPSELEHDPIDYEIGAVWAFNADGSLDGTDVEEGGNLAISGPSNNNIVLGSAGADTTLNNGNVNIQVSFTTYGVDAEDFSNDGVYTATATIPVSQMAIVGGNVVITEQTYNQAIKNAINSDPVLMEVLEAADGPGNSLVVYTKIDGDFDGDELDVSITNYQFNGSAQLGPVTPRPNEYDTNNLNGNDGGGEGGEVLFADYGSVSAVESDNTINVSADGDSDVFVLSTSDAGVPDLSDDVDNLFTDLNGASNELLRFADGNFGSDTIFNFDEDTGALGSDGSDVMDFLAINYDGTQFSNGTFIATADSISIEATNAGNDTAEEVADNYDGMAGGANDPAEAIAIVYDENDDNTGIVYLVTDTVSGDATATVIGEISLIGTDWDDLAATNFA